jgi:hypothetical protein
MRALSMIRAATPSSAERSLRSARSSLGITGSSSQTSAKMRGGSNQKSDRPKEKSLQHMQAFLN